MDLHRGHPPLFGSTVLEPVSIFGVKLPKPTFPWLTLLPGHLDEALVQGEVVPDGVLDPKKTKKTRLNTSLLLQHLPVWGG